MRVIILLLSLTLFFTPLVSAKEKGNIQIYCQPKVKVYVNKRFKSKSNDKQKGLLLKNLSYKRYQIKLSKGNVEEYITILLNDTLVEYYSERFTRIEDSAKTKLNPLDPLPGLIDFVPVEVMPEMIYEKPPEKTKNYSKNGTKVSVWVKAQVGVDGSVLKAQVGKSSGSKLCDDSAVKAAYNNKFKPGIQNGKPVACWVTYKVEFRIDKSYKENITEEQLDKNSDSSFPGPDEPVSVDIMPVILKEKQPEYPTLTKAAGIEGIVWIKAFIDENGDVLNAMIAKSSGSYSLDNSALEAANENKFKPATRDGKPIAVWVTYRVVFSLN